MSITLTSLEHGHRIRLARATNIGFTTPAASLQECSYKGGEPNRTNLSGVRIVPEGANFLVHRIDMLSGTVAGWFIWRESGSVIAGYAMGCEGHMFDRLGRSPLSRIVGEPKPGEGNPPKPQGGKGLTAEARAAIGTLCPKCRAALLVEKVGRFGAFVGCEGFPKCDFIWKKAEPQAQEPQQAKPEPQPPQVPQQIQPMPQQAQAPQGDDAEQLAEILRRLAGNKAQPIDADAVRQIVKAEMANIQPGKVEYHVKVNDTAPKQLKNRPHKAMAEVLRRAQMKNHRGMRVAQLLVGEAGTGKSTLCENVAEAMGLPFVYLSCSGGMSETKLVGRMTPNLQSGEEKYTPTPLVHAWEFGGVTLVDEIDAADPNVLLVLNGMMEATFWTAPDGRTIQRHADFILVAAANTYGHGADRKYVGRNQLDAAFLDRWLTLTVDYDTDLEESLVSTKGLAAKWAGCRRKIRDLGMRRVLSTRSLLRADMLIHQLGYSQADAVTAATDGWTPEERSKVGLV